MARKTPVSCSETQWMTDFFFFYFFVAVVIALTYCSCTAIILSPSFFFFTATLMQNLKDVFFFLSFSVHVFMCRR